MRQSLPVELLQETRLFTIVGYRSEGHGFFREDGVQDRHGRRPCEHAHVEDSLPSEPGRTIRR